MGADFDKDFTLSEDSLMVIKLLGANLDSDIRADVIRELTPMRNSSRAISAVMEAIESIED